MLDLEGDGHSIHVYRKSLRLLLGAAHWSVQVRDVYVSCPPNRPNSMSDPRLFTCPSRALGGPDSEATVSYASRVRQEFAELGSSSPTNKGCTRPSNIMDVLSGTS